MSFNYGPIATKAQAIIAKFGGVVALELSSSPAPADPNKPWRGPGPGTVVKSPKGVVARFEKNEINGESILVTDIKLLLSPKDPELLGVDIERAKFCTVNGIVYGAIPVDNVAPDGGATPLLYTLRLRQG